MDWRKALQAHGLERTASIWIRNLAGSPLALWRQASGAGLAGRFASRAGAWRPRPGANAALGRAAATGRSLAYAYAFPHGDDGPIPKPYAKPYAHAHHPAHGHAHADAKAHAAADPQAHAATNPAPYPAANPSAYAAAYALAHPALGAVAHPHRQPHAQPHAGAYAHPAAAGSGAQAHGHGARPPTGFCARAYGPDTRSRTQNRPAVTFL